MLISNKEVHMSENFSLTNLTLAQLGIIEDALLELCSQASTYPDKDKVSALYGIVVDQIVDQVYEPGQDNNV
jgi:hypothetical protein